jgi:hypothetical protein
MVPLLLDGAPHCLGPVKLGVDAWILRLEVLCRTSCPGGDSRVSQSPGWHWHEGQASC